MRQTDAEILNTEKEIDRVRLERDEVAQKFSDLEFKYRQEMDTTEGRKWQVDSLHRMHIKLLATRSFEETFQKIICENKRFVLGHMQYVTTGFVNQFGAVHKFRSVLLNSNRRIVKNAMQRWFRLACRPINMIKINEQLPRFFLPKI